MSANRKRWACPFLVRKAGYTGCALTGGPVNKELLLDCERMRKYCSNRTRGKSRQESIDLMDSRGSREGSQ